MLLKKVLGNIKKPVAVTVNKSSQSPDYALFSAYPFDRGYGQTVGNTLRRILLSSTYGYAIVAFKVTVIDGKKQRRYLASEYENIPGVRETTMEFIARLKQLSLTLKGNEEAYTGHYTFKGEQVLTGANFSQGSVEVFNSSFIVANLLGDAHFELDIHVEYGSGYLNHETEKDSVDDVHTILVDAIFTPVKRVAFSIENARVGQKSDYDKLLLEVWTNGSVSPEEALSQAALLAKAHFETFNRLELVPEDLEYQEDPAQTTLEATLEANVSKLDLSVRALNCLKRATIQTLWDLVSKTEDELTQTKSFGKKSLDEIKGRLAEKNLRLGILSKEQAYKLLKGESL